MTTSWESMMSESAHEHFCPRWPHRLLRRLLLPTSSPWNRWIRSVFRKICPTVEGQWVKEYRNYLKEQFK